MIFYAWFLFAVALAAVAAGGLSFWAHERRWMSPQGDERLERIDRIGTYVMFVAIAICLLLCIMAPFAYMGFA